MMVRKRRSRIEGIDPDELFDQLSTISSQLETATSRLRSLIEDLRREEEERRDSAF
jgi:hypothetical protein